MQTASLAESMQSVRISEASLAFSTGGARRKPAGSSSQSANVRRDEDTYERGSVKHDRELASSSTSHSYASVSNAKGRKDAVGSQFDDADDDAFSSVSTGRARDTDQESEVIYLIASAFRNNAYFEKFSLGPTYNQNQWCLEERGGGVEPIDAKKMLLHVLIINL